MPCRIPHVIFTGVERRREAIAEARERGLVGAKRPGDELLLATGPDPSDTYIGELVDSFEEGRRERARKQAGGKS